MNLSMLNPSDDQIRAWGEAAVHEMAEYLASLPDRRVYPETSAAEIRAQLDPTLPLTGTDFGGLLKTWRDTLVPYSRQNAHPRMFGYVQAPGTAVAAFADLLTSTLNANLTAWRSAPAAVELERLTIDWIRQIVGLPAGAAGLFVSGGSMANLAALAAARDAKPNPTGKRLRIYASTETHHSVAKAAALLGLGRDSVRSVAVDERLTVRIDDLAAKIETDFAAGDLPLCVVANAGTVNTGACDPLDEIRQIAQRSTFGCMWTRATAGSPSWRRARTNSSPGWQEPTRSRSTRTSGFTCLSTAAACCTAIRSTRAPRSRTTQSTRG
jgi:hypothetical protein